MANFNKTLQQVLGYTSLVSGLLGNKGTQPLQHQEGYKNFSDSVRAGVRKFGVQKTSMAHVFIPSLPKILSQQAVSASVEDNIATASPKLLSLATYRADSFAQPGVSFATSEIRRYGVGPVERKPYTPIFTDLNMTFIGDSDGALHKFFYLWMNSIINYTQLPQGNSGTFNKAFPFEVNYKDDYKVNSIDIYTYNEAQFKVGVLKLYNAYPIFLGEVQRNWADTDQIVRMPVTFTYSHWSYSDEDITSIVEPVMLGQKRDNSLSLAQSILKTGSILQALSATKRPQNINDVLNIVNTGSTLLRSLFPSNIEPPVNDYYERRGFGPTTD